MPTRIISKLWTRLALTLTLCAALLLTSCSNKNGQQAEQSIPIHSAQSVTTHCQSALNKAREEALALSLTAAKELTVLGFLEPWDQTGAGINRVLGPIYLQAHVHPDAEVREAAEACILDVTRFQTELFQNPELFSRVMQLKIEGPHKLVSEQLKKDLIDGFIQQGVSLNPSKRQRAADIQQSIQQLSQAFQRQLRENQQTISLSQAEVAGMSAAWLEGKKQTNGSYTASFDYPDYFPFMRNAQNSEARKRYFQGFLNRGSEENLIRLNKINKLRQEMAQLHGLDNFSEYATRNRMAKNPDTVNAFLHEVKTKVAPIERADLAELQALKNQELGQQQPLQRWDLRYYTELARKQKFDIDQEALREFFPSDATIQWALHINEQLLGITITRKENKAWHSDVRYYDVYDRKTQDYLGGMYLDLFPREGKYKHAAAFSVRDGSGLNQQKPISALVTNFDRRGFTQSEIATLLHELGHVFHGVLSQTWYASHAGTEVKRDFVEAPSQMLEAWARSYDTLSQISDFCEDCPSITPAMVANLEAARLFAQGIFYARQQLYASYDMTLASGTQEALALWQQMEGATPLGYVANSQFPATFGHIAGGYAAAYYGYLWSEVLAADMQSQFGQQLMNPVLGLKYRQEILAKGGERPPSELVKNFLGREPSSEAFFKQFSRPAEQPAKQPQY